MQIKWPIIGGQWAASVRARMRKTTRTTVTPPPTGSTDFQEHTVLHSFSLQIINTKRPQMAFFCESLP